MEETDGSIDERPAAGRAWSQALFRSRRGGTSGCTSPGWARSGPTTRCRSSCVARAATSGTTTATAISTGSQALFCVNSGHGRAELGDAMAAQVRELDFVTVWSYAHPRAIELATRIASLTPGDLNRVFFTNSGSEAVESAMKLARSYHRSRGNGQKTKLIAREIAYHGTTLGALSATGIPALRANFEPLVPGGIHVPNTLQLPLAGRQGPALGRGPDRGGDRVRGARDGRGGDPRAAAERRRLHPPAGRLLRSRAGDLRSQRRPADLRRGDLRLGPPRPLFRLPALRLPAGHHDRRQGADLGLRADGRDDRLGPGLRALRRGHGHVLPRLDLRRAPGRGRHRDGEPGRLRARGPLRPRPRQGRRVQGGARVALRHPDRRRRARRRLLLRDRAGQGPGDQGVVQRRGVREPAARISLRRALPPRADLPRRRPRRPGRAARHRR